MTTISCREAVSRMWTYLSRDLEPPRTEELEQHLGVCLRCCGELEFSRELRSKVAAAGEERVPADLRARLDEVLERNEPAGGAS